MKKNLRINRTKQETEREREEEGGVVGRGNKNQTYKDTKRRNLENLSTVADVISDAAVYRTLVSYFIVIEYLPC